MVSLKSGKRQCLAKTSLFLVFMLVDVAQTFGICQDPLFFLRFKNDVPTSATAHVISIFSSLARSLEWGNLRLLEAFGYGC